MGIKLLKYDYKQCFRQIGQNDEYLVTLCVLAATSEKEPVAMEANLCDGSTNVASTYT